MPIHNDAPKARGVSPRSGVSESFLRLAKRLAYQLTAAREPCLTMSFSSSQTARPVLRSVSESWKANSDCLIVGSKPRLARALFSETFRNSLLRLLCFLRRLNPDWIVVEGWSASAAFYDKWHRY